jgi:hypothetical protein
VSGNQRAILWSEALITWSEALITKSPLKCNPERASFNNPGGFLLSHAVARAVPSAPRGLTSVFGMGTGVTLSTQPPENFSKTIFGLGTLIFAFVNARLNLSSCVDFKDQRSKFKDQISFGSGDLAVGRANNLMLAQLDRPKPALRN